MENLSLFKIITSFGVIIFLSACNANASTITPSPTPKPVMTAPTPTPAPATAVLSPTPLPATATSPPTSEANSAANADVQFVKITQAADGIWRFDVTVAHPDTGWDDYADGWDVVLPDGSVVKPNPADPFTRLLLHPHETEQPFTRSQSGIRIPADVTTVTVRAHDLVDGWGGKTITVDLTQPSGDGFEVQK